MSASEDMTPQEAAQVMRRWADAVETVTSAAADHRAEQLEQELSRERALGEAANGERNTVGEAMLRFRHERDEFRTRAESAEARVEELEAESARLKLEREGWGRLYKNAAQECDDLRAENARLEQEVAEVTEDYKVSIDSAGREWANARHLRAENERLTDQLENYAKELAHLLTAVPRVIRPGEIQVGQKIAWTGWESGDWYIQTATTNGGAFAPGYPGTIVLLEDAPEDADDEAGDAEADGDDWEPLPDEAGAVIEVVEFNRAPMTPQLARKLGRHAGRPFWWSLVSGDTWPDGSEVADPEEITRWRWPAEGGDDR